MVNLWAWEKIWHPSRCPWVKVTKLPKQDRIYIVPHDKVRTAHSIATKLSRYIPIVMLSTLSNFGGILFATFFSKYFRKISNPSFPIQTFYLPYLWNGGSNWCEIKRKWVNSMLRLLGYLWTRLLTLTFDLEFSRSNCISGMGGPIVMAWRGRESIGCPDAKHKYYVTAKQRILLGTAVTWDVGVSVDCLITSYKWYGCNHLPLIPASGTTLLTFYLPSNL